MKSRALLAIVLLFFALPAHADHSININTADKAALETLNGIGPSKAQAIIDYRTQDGPFASIEDINNVSGIGEATYNNIKDHITVSGGVSAPKADPATQPPISGQTSPQPSLQTASASASNELSIEAGSDRVVVVGSDSIFSVRAHLGKAVVVDASYTWNFGDGATTNGESALHSFAYPGRYAVVVTGSKDGESATDRFTVTAEDAQLVVIVNADGSVKIENSGARDIDLSRWLIRSSGQRFVLPENSLVLAGQSMHISPDTLHFYAGPGTELAYPSDLLAFRSVAEVQLPTTQSETSADTAAPEKPAPSPRIVESAVVTQKSTATEEEVDESFSDGKGTTNSQVAAVGKAASGGWLWWMSAAGLSALAGGAVVVSRRISKREWNIVEDTSE